MWRRTSWVAVVALTVGLLLSATACSVGSESSLDDSTSDDSSSDDSASDDSSYDDSASGTDFVPADACSLLGESLEGIEFPIAAPAQPVLEFSDDAPSLAIWMEPDASPEHVAAVEASLTNDPAVASISYIDAAEARAEFEGLFDGSPEVVALTRLYPLPTRFDVFFVDRRVLTDEEVAQYEDLASVLRVLNLSEIAQSANDSATRPAQLPDLTLGQLLAGPYLFEGVAIFVDADADAATIEAIRAELEADPDVTSVRYLDQNAAYEEAVAILDEKFTADLSPEVLPTSFRLLINDPAQFESVADRWRNREHIRTVTIASTLAVGGHISFAAAALDQSEPRMLTSQLRAASSATDLKDITSLLAAAEAFRANPTFWSDITEWANLVGPTGAVSEIVWADAFAEANEVRSEMENCGLDLCVGRTCVNLLTQAFPELVGG